MSSFALTENALKEHNKYIKYHSKSPPPNNIHGNSHHSIHGHQSHSHSHHSHHGKHIINGPQGMYISHNNHHNNSYTNNIRGHSGHGSPTHNTMHRQHGSHIHHPHSYPINANNINNNININNHNGNHYYYNNNNNNNNNGIMSGVPKQLTTEQKAEISRIESKLALKLEELKRINQMLKKRNYDLKNTATVFNANIEIPKVNSKLNDDLNEIKSDNDNIGHERLDTQFRIEIAMHVSNLNITKDIERLRNENDKLMNENIDLKNKKASQLKGFEHSLNASKISLPALPIIESNTSLGYQNSLSITRSDASITDDIMMNKFTIEPKKTTTLNVSNHNSVNIPSKVNKKSKKQPKYLPKSRYSPMFENANWMINSFKNDSNNINACNNNSNKHFRTKCKNKNSNLKSLNNNIHSNNGYNSNIKYSWI